MPTISFANGCYSEKRLRRKSFMSKARAKGIVEGSNGWYRYLRAHGC